MDITDILDIMGIMDIMYILYIRGILDIMAVLDFKGIMDIRNSLETKDTVEIMGKQAIPPVKDKSLLHCFGAFLWRRQVVFPFKIILISFDWALAYFCMYEYCTNTNTSITKYNYEYNDKCAFLAAGQPVGRKLNWFYYK